RRYRGPILRRPLYILRKKAIETLFFMRKPSVFQDFAARLRGIGPAGLDCSPFAAPFHTKSAPSLRRRARVFLAIAGYKPGFGCRP
ncbi:hypothetical protein, partial [Aliiroseovarius marinus]|uniref:hypothetical protein n=1 Tax=Aliiroseovarius marinus TaxID=2500159 RepID=UPI00196B4262